MARAPYAENATFPRDPMACAASAAAGSPSVDAAPFSRSMPTATRTLPGPDSPGPPA
ncbi:hypothetical protein ACIP88_16905 [Streptomyces uncialis]|uniref:hypothetical protein n=1 Tax=Streptomyces uncialis TaxID=1048205 RepID=UPI0038123CCF